MGREHPYLIGLLFLGVGALGAYGSLTGRLAAMLGALFDPHVLKITSTSPLSKSLGSTVLDAIGDLVTGNVSAAKRRVVTNPFSKGEAVGSSLTQWLDNHVPGWSALP